MTSTLLRSTGDLPALTATLGPTTDVSSLAAYLECRQRGLRARMAAPLAAFAAQAAG